MGGQEPRASEPRPRPVPVLDESDSESDHRDPTATRATHALRLWHSG